MTTKEQERKALAQIRKIVEGLGENSYIGTAFDGCFEKAEQNIDDDAAYSWKGEAEYFQQAANMYAARATEVENELAKAKNQLEIAEHNAKVNRDNAQTLNTSYCEELQKNKDLKAELEAKDLEIIKLKARLFDLIDK